MIEAIIHLMTPIFYITILPGIAMGIFMVVFTTRTLLGIKEWSYTEAYRGTHRGRDVSIMIIALVILNIIMGAFLLFNWPSEGTGSLRPVLYGILGVNLLFLYFIVFDVAIIQLAKKRLRVLSADGSAARPEQPTKEEDER